VLWGAGRSNFLGGLVRGGAWYIAKTPHGDYKITFPIAEKAAVKGANAHAFYKWAAAERPGEQPRWNFHKYLVGRDGRLKASFGSSVNPTDPQVIVAIESELTAR
jgi:glutathione peroxidase